ncbi:response regulator transcription factor [Undibacterium umbellatum]|uniref:Response regulator transcription factor n=1 Tax=Undibacterium umbellatum TaxID=2762300 RepID=A0ABR6ZHJ0_9BURK|nr:response regulator [Undibacterium umbellatum]MBC3910697.1 response regulator transcription factor [Undibacterium umbellatum]
MTEVANVFLVDDQPAVLKAMARLLQSAGVSAVTFESAQAFLDSGNASKAGCLVLDLAMPDMDGMALQGKLTAMGSDLPIIFLTGHGSIDTGVLAMKLGAQDFLTKPVDADKLLAAVQTAFERNRLARLASAEKQVIQARLNSLTPRELEVLYLLVEGKLNKQVAAELGTVEKTIKVHRAKVMSKMDVTSVAALIHMLEKLKG